MNLKRSVNLSAKVKDELYITQNIAVVDGHIGFEHHADLSRSAC